MDPERSGRVSLKPVDRNLEMEVLSRVRSGDVEAFEYFVRMYQKRLFRFVYTLVRDPHEADGITQDAFVKAFRSLPSFKGESSFETWLIRIAINTVRDQERRKRPVISFSEMAQEEDNPDGPLPRSVDPTDGTSPEREALSREIRRRINRALDSLSPRQRAVFVLKHYSQKSIPEISKAIGLDEGTIKSHLFRAARKLRELLEDLK